MTITLARVIETCAGCPSQWDAWDITGQYLYLRYRSGIGTVDYYDGPGPDGWEQPPDGRVARFDDPDDPLGGSIELRDFCERAGLVLMPDCETLRS